MLPIRLTIKNFLAYRNPDPVRFDGIYLACLTGANGAGKSSLLDAITWALWGKARAHRDEDLVHMGQTEMLVELDFGQEGIVYRVIRRRSRRSGTGTLDLFSIDTDGSLITLSEPNKTATQAKINRLLRMDYETFVHSAFLQQGKADAFTTATPLKRKQILTDMLGLVRWETYETTVKDTLKALEKSIDLYRERLVEIDAELAREPRYRQEVADAEAIQREALAALNAALEQMREVEGATRDLRKVNERKAEIDQRLRGYADDEKTLREQQTRHEGRIRDYAAVVAAKDEIEQGYVILQAAREDSQALADKLEQRGSFDKQRTALERQIERVTADLLQDARTYETQIAALEKQVTAAKHQELAEAQTELAALAGVDERLEMLQNERVALQGERQGLTTLFEVYRLEGQTINGRIERLQHVEGAECPLCGQPLSEDNRLALIDQLQNDVDSKRETYKINQTRVKEIDVSVRDHESTLKAADLERRRRDNLTALASALQVGVDEAHRAALELDERLAQLDAVRDVLDRSDYAHELRDQMRELDAQIAQIGYDNVRHSTAKKQLSDYVAYQEQYTKLTTALEALPDMQASLDVTLQRIERLEAARREDEQANLEAALDVARLTVLVNEYKIRQEEVNRQRTLESQANIRLGAAQQSLNALTSLRDRRAVIELDLAQARDQHAVYEELRLAFGKNGIPAMIIEAAIPELETSANRLLNRMTDGRMNLAITTQRDKITGGVAETLDIQIADELGTRNYEMFSGGEAFRVDFALRVALSQLLARRAGAHLRTLFVDEGFGTQDEDGRNKLIEAITAIQNDFAMILVITHIEELRDSFPVHIAIDKTSEGSRISVR